MLNVLYTELLKLKRTKILWLVVIGAVLPVLLNSYVDISSLSWNEFFNNNLLFLNVMIGPLLLSLLAGYVVAREYHEKTVNQLFVYPHRRVTILVGKTIVIILLSAAIYLLGFLLILLSGSLLGDKSISAELFWKYFNVYVWMFVLQALLVPVMMTAGMVGKSYIPPVVLGIVGLLISTMALVEIEGSGGVVYSSYFPFGSMIVHMMGMISQSKSDLNVIHPLYPHVITFLLFFLFNALYYTKSEVHSGS